MKRAMMISITIIGAFLLTPAHAQNRPFVDGNAWYERCRDSALNTQALCHGYALGVVDVLQVWKNTAPDTAPACIPSGIASSQLRDIRLQYIATRTKERHKPASELLISAFQEQWPCKK